MVIGGVRPSPRIHGPAVGPPRGRRLAALALSALGVVYGDIGTSPLYTLREVFGTRAGSTRARLPSRRALARGLVADPDSQRQVPDRHHPAPTTAVRGASWPSSPWRPADPEPGRLHRARALRAALFYGDGLITPAISVLRAVEGLETAAPAVAPYVLTADARACCSGSFGSSAAGPPVSAPSSARDAGLVRHLRAARGCRGRPAPRRTRGDQSGLRATVLFQIAGWQAFVVLGAIVLAVTGAEALYADLGHFGRGPIRLAWLGLVFPALVLNYFGQGAAACCASRRRSRNPFYHLGPELAALASDRARDLGHGHRQPGGDLGRVLTDRPGDPARPPVAHDGPPHLRLSDGPNLHPARELAAHGGRAALVVGFGSSGNLAAAYGISVTGTMAITSILFFAIARYRWRWPWWSAGALTAAFLIVDLTFLAANVGKIAGGGWVPLAVAALAVLMMTTWHRGTDLVMKTLAQLSVPLETFLERVEESKLPRVPGTAVFLTPDTEGAPLSLVHHVRYNRALHEEVILISVVTENVPEVEARTRMKSEPLGAGFWRVRAHYGFMEHPDVRWVVGRCCDHGMTARLEDTTFYLGRAYWIPEGPAQIARWRKRLFAFMSWNASSAPRLLRDPLGSCAGTRARIEF